MVLVRSRILAQRGTTGGVALCPRRHFPAGGPVHIWSQGPRCGVADGVRDMDLGPHGLSARLLLSSWFVWVLV